MHEQPTVLHRSVSLGTKAMLSMWLAMVVGSCFSQLSAHAENGDTKIHVSYGTKVVRVKPTAGVGRGRVDFHTILHADGTVSDSYDVRGSRKGSNVAKLGGSSIGATYKVLDANTIVRTGVGQTHTNITTIRVTGRKCTAPIERTL